MYKVVVVGPSGKVRQGGHPMGISWTLMVKSAFHRLGVLNILAGFMMHELFP